MVCGVLGVTTSLVLIAIYLRRKLDADDEEENGECHDK